jgi:uncharacterized delta-60 repeat protein
MIIERTSSAFLKNALIKFIEVFIFLIIVVSSRVSANAEELDLNFPLQGGANGTVYATALQPDGKILIAGNFSKVNGVSQQLIARLNSDGTLDKTFQPAANTVTIAVYSLVVQPDGKILLGGAFSRFNNAFENRIIRLNSDGSADAGFVPGGGANSTVKTIALEPDGRILVGGLFTSFDGKPANRIVRLNTNGSTDQSFAPASGANAAVETITVDNQGKILLGGAFTNVNGSARSGIARLNQDGSLDSSFNVGSGTAAGNTGSNNVYSIVVQTDDKVLVGGDFYFFNGMERHSVLRLKNDGSLDAEFNVGTGINGIVRQLTVLEDGRIIAAGAVSIHLPISRDRIVRLNSNGTVDATFNATYISSDVLSFVIQQDGKIVIGGQFGGVSLSLRNRIARLNPDGSIDSPFAPAGGANSSICKILSQADGKFLIGGSFTKFNGIARKGIARLNEDGTLDYTFDSSNGISEGNSSKICSIIPLADEKMIVGGEFESYSGTARRGIARLNADGSLDASFTGSLDSGYLHQVIRQPDGKLIIAGNFGGLNGTGLSNLARLNENGSIDASFSTGTGLIGRVNSAELHPNGKILIVGDFHRYNGIDREGIARLNTDGSLDAAFNAGAVAGSISGLLSQPDGKILVRGYFDSIGGVTRTRFARLNSDGSVDLSFDPGAGPYGLILDFILQPDGKIIIGGQFSAYNNITRNKLARIDRNGNLDTAFITGFGPNNNVGALLQQSNGNLILGGSFNAFSGVGTTNLVRLIGRNRSGFDFDGDGRSDVSVFRPESGMWHLQQSRLNYVAFRFGITTDKLAPADYDGDGKTDLAVFRENSNDPGKAKFFILQSSNNQLREEQLGSTGDIPVTGDWDGDGKTDVGVYRVGTEANQQGYFYYRPSSQPTVNFIPYPWGIAGDKPVVADYDGDGKSDPAVFRPSTGGWFVQRSRDGFYAIQFGASEDKPIVGDYDGDGKADQAVFRPSNGVWYLWNSTAGFSAAQFGISTDKPVPADYDGDGKTDMAVYRDGTWFILNSTTGFASIGFGNSTDKPVPNSFVP